MSNSSKEENSGVKPSESKNPFLRALAWVYLAVERIEWATLLIFLGTVLVLSLINILFRQKTYQIIFQHFTFYMCLLGASIATGNERHISIDILSRFIPKKLQPALLIVLNLVCAVVCIVLTRACYQYMSFLQPKEGMAPLTYVPEAPEWYWEQWRWKMPYVIMLGLVSFHFVVNVGKNAFRLMYGIPDNPDDASSSEEVAS